MEHLRKLQQELKNNLAVLFDVREQNEWDMGHLSQAILVSLSDLKASILPEKLDKSKKTYIHCRSGQRVLIAQPLLENEGFKTIIVLNEGFDDLANFGFDVE